MVSLLFKTNSLIFRNERKPMDSNVFKTKIVYFRSLSEIINYEWCKNRRQYKIYRFCEHKIKDHSNFGVYFRLVKRTAIFSILGWGYHDFIEKIYLPLFLFSFIIFCGTVKPKIEVENIEESLF